MKDIIDMIRADKNISKDFKKNLKPVYQHKESGVLHIRPWVLDWYIKSEWKLLS